jgi:hypothetical protein
MAKAISWWSCDTIKRAIHRLEKEGLLVSANYNTLKIDRTKWYRVNFDHPLLRRASSIGAKCPDEGQSALTITRDYNRDYNKYY